MRCGAVRYTLSAEPVATRLCWCRDCQYWALGNAAVNIMVPRAAVEVTGTPRHFESVADSGNLEYMVVVRVGTLDDASGIRPTMAIWTSSASPWAHIDPALQAFPRQPG